MSALVCVFLPCQPNDHYLNDGLKLDIRVGSLERVVVGSELQEGAAKEPRTSVQLTGETASATGNQQGREKEKEERTEKVQKKYSK